MIKVLKKKVVVKDPLDELFGKEGIIVAVKSLSNDNSEEGMVCKVLVGDSLSGWLPYQSLEQAVLSNKQTA
ncbi:MAG: hypothetical protein ABFC94_16660 [Syntrophomonas sp.]